MSANSLESHSNGELRTPIEMRRCVGRHFARGPKAVLEGNARMGLAKTGVAAGQAPLTPSTDLH